MHFHHNPNERWAWYGQDSGQTKHRYEPYTHPLTQEEQRDMSACLTGRRARWRQLELSHEALCVAVATDIAEHLRL
eukprot:4058050-Alexandrium_andersonii.AAC.1